MSAGLEVADVLRRHGGLQPTDLIRGEAYRRTHDARLGRVERRAMRAVELCRTAALGGHTEACAECGPRPLRLQLVPQPALPEVPGAGAQRVA